LKYEDVYPNSYKNIKEARTGINEYIEIYNSERLHSTLNYKTPDEIYYQGINNKSDNAKKMLLKVA
jgi:putative transposase